MQYLLLFLEGLITFISPCFLPLLPVYLLYLAGGDGADGTAPRKPLRGAIGFVSGFMLVFVSLGAFAASIGWILRDYSTIVNIVTGSVVVAFGLNYLGILRISALSNSSGGLAAHLGLQDIGIQAKPVGFVSAFVFGVVFSIGWTPCVGAFLGAALMRAAQQDTVAEGMFMLFVFSMGLGVPLIASAVLIDRLKGTFDFIKRHYRVINAFSGGLLVVIGILMMTGVFGRFAAMFTPLL
ncbi:MAG: cytochrome c biogenesis protein CcdA [Defluviitaleaceae bacterium]|nr:cytochrome c biogenesis protein CcdA [Defluviitaleaceae bacterium]